MSVKRWFITGASSGLGRELAEAVAARGDQVLAATRRPEALGDLVKEYEGRLEAVRCDVTDPESVRAAVATAEAALGGLDVVVNNAGYAVIGALEELSDEQLREQLEVNLLGVALVTRAVLPLLRRQRGGHLLQMSSISGAQPWVGFSAYVASKHAVEGLSSSLAAEVAHLGIKLTIIEPGPFKTAFFGPSLVRAPRLADYDGSIGEARAFFDGWDGQPGNPAKAAAAILAVADADDPPLRLALGAYAVAEFRAEYQRRLAEIDAWEHLSLGTDFPAAQGAS